MQKFICNSLNVGNCNVACVIEPMECHASTPRTCCYNGDKCEFIPMENIENTLDSLTHNVIHAKDSLDKAMEVPLDVDPGRKVNTTLKEDKGFNRKKCRQLSTPTCYGEFGKQSYNHCKSCKVWASCLNTEYILNGGYDA